ncbi:putative peptidyl-prolyl cis-trans isomerase [Planctomycetes bacterium CA13]|uniref:peptidylprolyl isomerase n=1 Tax=Novipirellula herctigrandis TaxID=2527986 RepID=A0A5C5Z908_9BACT|nr:putative peptidyl-prolyl cis-trans isomerase [Planctomycetes bacterium CA13]
MFAPPARLPLALFLCICASIPPLTTAQDSASPQETKPAPEVTPDAPQEQADAQPPSFDPSKMELTPEEERIKAKYNDIREKTRESILNMRELYTRYANKADRSPEAFERFHETSIASRKLLDELYQAAYEMLILIPDQEAAQYLLTMVEHNYTNSNYDELTMKGGALLMDLDFNQTFLYRAVSRASICTGEFEIAKKVYEYMNREAFDDLDKRFSYQIETLEKQWAQEKERRAEDAKNNLPRVRLRTTKGDVVVELFLEDAPSTVSNFISLVEEGFYDGIDFHQVLDDLLALTGDESGQGDGNSGKFLVDEHLREGSRNAFRGSLVMAKLPREDGSFLPDTASTQFAIFFTPIPEVREKQTVFGRVIEGMGLLSEIRRVDQNKEKKKDEVVLPPDRIIEAEVIRRPEKMPEPVYRTYQ